MTETAPDLLAADVVRLLDLKPHPEGGHYRETFRDPDPEGGRPYSTAVFYLLAAGERSAWHRVRDAAEVWHFYAGAPLLLRIAETRDSEVGRIVLGPALAAGERPQAIVPRDWWQTAESLGAWTLAGCTVAPGFTFASFEMAATDR